VTWEFAIDRGGTFTDCIGVAPDGSRHVAKPLSSDTAAIEGIRAILERAGALEPGAALPACRVRIGTTVATNALLERRGADVVLVANLGLGDVLEIGTQERPLLFDLAVRKPEPLARRVVEVPGRVAVDGAVVEEFDEAAARRELAAARAAGIDSVAINLIHAYAHPAFERRVRDIAVELGFAHVGVSHEVSGELGLLARGETTVVDAYLTPMLQSHVAALAAALPGSPLRFMQSSGGLTESARFRGPNALLSGPAGGVVGAARVAAAAGFARALGFDMGGTSTDVCFIADGDVDRSFETAIGGVRVKAPMLRIHTVAAGGGSLCRFDGFRFVVGPESAGSDPGPLCYGRAQARELAVTDVNFALGRIQGDHFPFALERARVERALDTVRAELRAAGHDYDRDRIAAGFVLVANASMAKAIAEVSVARGIDPRDCALVGFGGAAGQHVCAIARELGIETVLLHPLAGILSAVGIGAAAVSWDGQRDAGRLPLPLAGEPLPASVLAAFAELERAGDAALAHEGLAPERVRRERRLDLRYVGSETALAIPEPATGDFAAAFEAEHRARFGYLREGRAIEIVTARLRAWGEASDAAAFSVGVGSPPGAVSGAAARASTSAGGASEAALANAPAPDDAAVDSDAAAPVLRRESVWFPEVGRVSAPVYERDALGAGARIDGPALILEATGSVVLEPGFRARVGADGTLFLHDGTGPRRAAAVDLSSADPIRLEVFGNRFMGIAEQMGAVLRNTSVSTNIKERLDYSCAVFDAAGGLVANAPHIPVHLGAMAETVRAVRERFPELADGDVVATNDPSAGGSHLPDVTAVTPVFAGADAPAFFVASRGHHADIGGITPGSMPAESASLEDEGVLLRPFVLVRRGRFDEARLRELLTGARHPARNPDDNVAELEAMVAANRSGEALLTALVAEHGVTVLATTMRQLQQAAAAKVAREIAKLADGVHRFEDRLDDGTKIRVALAIEGDRMTIDFAGTDAAVPGNLNAPRAVVQAAVIYVLRSLVAERIPLNGGCLDPVEIRIPAGSLLDPPPGAAVVGGNVETSQRIVDVLLGAIGSVAASQGTMNNVAFGDAHYGYYETIGGGAGAGPDWDGASAVHSHMTNTRITDAEVLEARHPVRLLEFSRRRGSGGAGRHRGGDGLVRRYEFLAPVTVSLLCERRTTAPYGAAGGECGAMGRNAVENPDGSLRPVAGRATLRLESGQRLRIETPGGGGFGPRE